MISLEKETFFLFCMSESILDKVLIAKKDEAAAGFHPDAMLQRLLDLLNTRERDVIVRRFGLLGKTKETLDRIGKSLSITRERVRQIEWSALQKLKDLEKTGQHLTEIERALTHALTKADGAHSTEGLLKALAEQHGADSHRATFSFFLHELVPDRFRKINEDDDHLVESWALLTTEVERIRAAVQRIQGILAQNKTPMKRSAVLEAHKKAHPEIAMDENTLDFHLGLAKHVGKTPFGEVGLRSWSTISPRRMTDKIFLVLRHHGKPLHFTDITTKINEAKFDRRIAHAPTVHNELLLDDRYVLVGRGLYALADWGYRPGTVAEVIIAILKEVGTPLTREEIIDRVLRERLVGRSTIQVALMNRSRFTRDAEGKYTLTQKTA